MMDHTALSLTDLPEDTLLSIFEFCDSQSLGRLATSCRTFKRILDDNDYLWRDKSRFVLGSNMAASSMRKRSTPYLSFKVRCEISKKWQKGNCKTREILNYRRCLPWLFLDQSYLYCSKEASLVQIHRDRCGNPNPKAMRHVLTSYADDVSKFAVNKSEIVTGGRDGMLQRWGRYDLHNKGRVKAHFLDILTVDAKSDIIISGSKDKHVKIWKSYPNAIVSKAEIFMSIRVLSTAIMPNNGFFIVGTPGTNGIYPLQLFDLERVDYISHFGNNTYQNGAGVLDIYPECDNVFLASGYDTAVRLWDIRTPEKHVSEFVDPYDNSIYCVRSDYNVTIVSGSYLGGLVNVWDKRWNRHKKTYYNLAHSSPVYSIAFDASHLYAAFERGVVQFSFL